MINRSICGGRGRFFWLLPFLLVGLLTVLVPISEVDGAGKKYALIVGVKKYRPNQPLPELAYTENDADALAKVLNAGGYDVTLMTQTEGRTEGKEMFSPQASYIRDQLDSILGSKFLTADDTVLVALTGHGVQYEFTEGEKKTGRFYFCPADADVAKIKTANEITEGHGVIDLDELYAALNSSKAGGKLLLVDACRNDPTKPSLVRSANSTTLPALPPPPGGIAAFFSCSASEQAIEDADLKHGVFFHHIIEGLKGDADAGNAKYPADGEITLAELSGHVGRGTYDFVRKKYAGYKQTPELKGEYRVSIPLLKLPQAVSPSDMILSAKMPRVNTLVASDKNDAKPIAKLSGTTEFADGSKIIVGRPREGGPPLAKTAKKFKGWESLSSLIPPEMVDEWNRSNEQYFEHLHATETDRIERAYTGIKVAMSIADLAPMKFYRKGAKVPDEVLEALEAMSIAFLAVNEKLDKRKVNPILEAIKKLE